jgi:hypothetical protein
VQVVGGIYYHSRHVHVVRFLISRLKRVVVKKRQLFPCNLQGINCTKLLNENACPSFPIVSKTCFISFKMELHK